MEFNKEIAEDLVKRFSYFHNERLEGFGGVEEYEEIVAAILAVAQVQMEFELEYAESPVSVQDKPMFPTPGATKFL